MTVPANHAAADPGFAAHPVSDVLAENEALLARIKLCYGADRTMFDRELMPVVRRYAAYVHLLPATGDNYFSAPGGLLRLGLETAFFSLQGTDAHIFSGRATISSRRELEPRWRIATFVGGLCCELHRALSHMSVTTPNGEEWPALLLPLVEWLQQRGADRYFLRWRPQVAELRGLGLFALPQVIPTTLLHQFSQDGGTIVRQLFACIGGLPQHRETNVLDALVRRSLALVIDRNLQAKTNRHGTLQRGSHLERYLVAVMRHVAATHSSWVPNRDKSRLWHGEDGLYLVWPGAANDMLHLLDSEQLAGMPTTPETILELLLDAGVFEATTEGCPTWLIQTPGTKDPIKAAKLASPEMLLAVLDPAPTPPTHRLHRDPEKPLRPAEGLTGSTMDRAAPLVVTPSQLSLIEPDTPATIAARASPLEAESSPTRSVPTTAVSPPRPIQLNAPMRLNTSVRQAAANLIDGLNDPPATAVVFTVAEGVFMPLAELERCGVQPTVAMRALADAGMLIKPTRAGPPTFSHEVRGTSVVGVVVDPSFVLGLDPTTFVGAADQRG
jgi:conjugal transfer pilus assembly protein TraI